MNPDEIPVCPDLTAPTQEESDQRVREMLKQGDRDIAAGHGTTLEDVMTEMDDRP